MAKDKEPRQEGSVRREFLTKELPAAFVGAANAGKIVAAVAAAGAATGGVAVDFFAKAMPMLQFSAFPFAYPAQAIKKKYNLDFGSRLIDTNVFDLSGYRAGTAQTNLPHMGQSVHAAYLEEFKKTTLDPLDEMIKFYDANAAAIGDEFGAREMVDIFKAQYEDATKGAMAQNMKRECDMMQEDVTGVRPTDAIHTDKDMAEFRGRRIAKMVAEKRQKEFEETTRKAGNVKINITKGLPVAYKAVISADSYEVVEGIARGFMANDGAISLQGKHNDWKLNEKDRKRNGARLAIYEERNPHFTPLNQETPVTGAYVVIEDANRRLQKTLQDMENALAKKDKGAKR